MIKYEITTKSDFNTDVLFHIDHVYYFAYKLYQHSFIISNVGRGLRIHQNYG